MGVLTLSVLLIVCLTVPSINAKIYVYKTKIEEGGKILEQITRINVETGFEYFHVPKHGKVDETIVVVDNNKKLVLTKFPRAGTCYLRKFLHDDVGPRSLKKGMTKMRSRFPWHRYITANHNELIVNEITNIGQYSKPFMKLCGKNKVYYVTPAPYENKEIAKLAMKIAKGMAGRKSKRQKTVRNFVACDATSNEALSRCLSTSGGSNYLGAMCRFRASGCIYIASCTYQYGSFYCQAAHSYHAVFCCDFTCSL